MRKSNQHSVRAHLSFFICCVVLDSILEEVRRAGSAEGLAIGHQFKAQEDLAWG
jgi:hypothetical protein